MLHRLGREAEFWERGAGAKHLVNEMLATRDLGADVQHHLASHLTSSSHLNKSGRTYKEDRRARPTDYCREDVGSLRNSYANRLQKWRPSQRKEVQRFQRGGGRLESTGA